MKKFNVKMRNADVTDRICLEGFILARGGMYKYRGNGDLYVECDSQTYMEISNEYITY